MNTEKLPADFAAVLVRKTVAGPLPLLMVFVALLAGLFSVLVIPREEEPQIVVPLADILMSAPGLSARQIERQVTNPLEKLLHQIDGVEYVYSVSRPGSSVVSVRFFVGEDREDSLVKIHNKLLSEKDEIPPSIASWVVKPIEVDDASILNIALWAAPEAQMHDFELRQIGEEIAYKLQSIKQTNRVEVTGGRRREIRVELDPATLSAYLTTPMDVAWAIEVSNQRQFSGHIEQQDHSIVIETGEPIADMVALRSLVVNVVDGIPVYLSDLGQVFDGPEIAKNYTWIGFGQGADNPGAYPAVVISVAKQKGSNAVSVANEVTAALKAFEQTLLPAGVHFTVTRNYGDTADQKVNDLIVSLFISVVSVVAFTSIVLGWRAGLVVGLAIPTCYGAVLGLDLLFGYSINRVTLFALILVLGLLVDDPIAGVDNIERHLRIDSGSKVDCIVVAISEIRWPLIMSSLAIMVAFLPLNFISGMMGPYLAPMAFNVPVAIILSTLITFIITPQVAKFMLRQQPVGEDFKQTKVYSFYARLLTPMLCSRRNAWRVLMVIGLLFVASSLLPLLQIVPMKLLPFDNKNEFQIVVDMPEGTSLERTQAVVQRLGLYLGRIPEVTSFVAYVGTVSPMDLNAMVRQYYLREQYHSADIRVQLADRLLRQHQSHTLILKIRRDIEAIARTEGASLKIVEVPPGPPVVSTITVEVYGDADTSYQELQQAAAMVEQRLRREPLVVDVDSSVIAPQQRMRFVVDKTKAALSGVTTADIATTTQFATSGLVVGHLFDENEITPTVIRLKLPQTDKGSLAALGTIQVKGIAGVAKRRDRGAVVDAAQPFVTLSELGRWQSGTVDQTIHHKQLQPVVYLFAELSGRAPAEAINDLIADLTVATPESTTETAPDSIPKPLKQRSYLSPGGGDLWSIPAATRLNWTGEGELHITLTVFRDMAISFSVALVGIFFLLYLQINSARMALIIMSAIPLIVIGVLPGFWLLNNIGERLVNGLPDPEFFTVTAMIGMIALAGIVVRNSLILVEFIHAESNRTGDLTDALISAGAVRLRPVLLTGGTTILGSMVITLDPVFSGLAWAIIFGTGASTIFTLFVIPIVYFLSFGRRV
ncbi:MAG: efflux RND transporter permease subunit [Pseudomonadales bacterium]|nr:efflux RND transporter permease subunit [Pseudomonadales bacterium]